eukprot:TRINITY_DN4848_c0_g1_i1.p2 TRINITY_DN4848_c0_g1~~TRINITY_DN4848_c0_g1_i1.p2  ORF type:complete len:115 (-),score=8.92 TRINITY_DN4848_c0_g1_i1:111-455(-)
MAVLFIQRNHVVAAIEGAEERDLQRRAVGIAGEPGNAVCFLPDPTLGVITFINHIYAAIAAQTVSRGDLFQPAFEMMIEAGDFIPGAEEALAFKWADDGHASGRNGIAARNAQQ